MNKTKQKFLGICILGFALVMSGCTSMPSYKSMDTDETAAANTAVSYRINPALSSHGLECLVIMPLSIGPDAHNLIHFNTAQQSDESVDSGGIQQDEIYDHELDGNDKQQMLRQSLYAFIAPHKTRDIELSQVDRWAHAGDMRPDYNKLSRKLDCQWFLEGELTQFSADYYGVYSKIVIAADLRIIRGKDKKVVWKGKHEARSDDGSLPLSPVGLAVGAVKAASHINPEQVERTTTDLARRLVRTMPLDANNNFLFAAKRTQLMKVIASNLNLRKGPGRKYAVSKVLKNREQVTFLQSAEKQPWLLVRTEDGLKGYVSGRYVN